MFGPNFGELEEIGHGELAASRRYGGRGFQRASEYRYELRSVCSRPTRTSATMRPPTGPSCAALADDLSLLEDVEPQWCFAVPLGMVEISLRLWFST